MPWHRRRPPALATRHLRNHHVESCLSPRIFKCAYGALVHAGERIFWPTKMVVDLPRRGLPMAPLVFFARLPQVFLHGDQADTLAPLVNVGLVLDGLGNWFAAGRVQLRAIHLALVFAAAHAIGQIRKILLAGFFLLDRLAHEAKGLFLKALVVVGMLYQEPDFVSPLFADKALARPAVLLEDLLEALDAPVV